MARKNDRNGDDVRVRSVVVGVFDTKQDAARAVAELRNAGFDNDRIGVAARDPDVREEVRQGAGENDTYAGAAGATGVIGGAAVGALWGIAVAAGALPAIGPVIAGGTLAAILISAATGAAVAGLVGALVGMGIPEEEAKHYESEVRAGRILVGVRADDRFGEAWDIMRQCNVRPDPSSAPAAR